MMITRGLMIILTMTPGLIKLAYIRMSTTPVSIVGYKGIMKTSITIRARGYKVCNGLVPSSRGLARIKIGCIINRRTTSIKNPPEGAYGARIGTTLGLFLGKFGNTKSVT